MLLYLRHSNNYAGLVGIPDVDPASGQEERGVIALHARRLAPGVCKERNARLFDQRSACMSIILNGIRQDIDLWIAAGARKLGRLFGEYSLRPKISVRLTFKFCPTKSVHLAPSETYLIKATLTSIKITCIEKCIEPIK